MERSKIAVIYHSQTAGNTKAAAELVAEGIRDEGRFDVELHNTNEERVEPTLLAECAGVAVGTPDYFSYPAGGLKVFIDDWLIAKRADNEGIEGLPVALFMTHGGGGAARGPFEDLFQRIGPRVGETLSMKGHPQGDQVEACRELGRRLAAEAAQFVGGQ